MNHFARCSVALESSLLVVAVIALLLGPLPHAEAQSLRGNLASMKEQNRQAHLHDFSFLQTAAQVHRFVAAGLLVPVTDTDDYAVANVSFPYARPELKLFIERLGGQYRAACGERLVVTSLTRPISAQPGNASRRSVHPAGMAVDLRRHDKSACRKWLERVLLQLEGDGVLEATREHHPPHYHVALYPSPYVDYVERITGHRVSLDSTPARAKPTFTSYTVANGDTLWRIARDHGTTPTTIQAVNALPSSRIYRGQVLKIPAGAVSSE